MILFLLLTAAVQAYNCGIAPVQLNIKNTPLDNGVPNNRGAQVQFPGNQILGLRMCTAWNNTFISNANNCRSGNASYQNACEGAVGSTFDPVENTGWTPYLDTTWNSLVGHVDDPPADTSIVKGVADVEFDGGTTIDLPVAIWSNPSIDPVNTPGAPPSRSVLGIGSSSDLVRSFLNQSVVPSGYMGLYFGSRSLNCSEDGQMTVGGWDESRVNGSFVNYTMNSVLINTTCPLVVRVKAFVLNNDQGSFNLISSGATVPACVDPFQNAIGVTDALYSIWANLTQHPTQPDGPPFTDQTYPLANEHLMDTLDIELEGGYSTTISHCELVSLERGADLETVGQYTVVNNSRLEVSVSAGQNDLGDNYGIWLGGAFLASTYLRIDYENNQFSLAPSVKGSSISPNLQKVCSKDTSIPAKTNGTIPATSPTPSSSSSKGGLSADTKATIGGTIAGGIIAIVGVSIAYLAYRHAQRSDRAREKRENDMLELERSRTVSTATWTSPMTRTLNETSPRMHQSEGGEGSAPSIELPKPGLDARSTQ